MKPKISVVIPTFNRVNILKKCLDSIFKNDLIGVFEVIIVDDGSNDNTFGEISKYIIKKNLKNIYIYRENNSGPGNARNLGIKKANSNIILFIGDDCIARPNLLTEHYKWNTERFPEENIGILGFSKWSDEIEVTPFMKWIDKKHLQFSYERLRGENSTSWKDFWTCNFSLKKSFLLKYGLFDKEFPSAAWEDVELGWRLSKFGFNIKYNKAAKIGHCHPTSLISFEKRMAVLGYSQMILARKMGNEYKNKLLKQPLKSIILIFDKMITYLGFLFIFERLAILLEKKVAISIILYPVLYHYKLRGIRQYEKTKNCYR